QKADDAQDDEFTLADPEKSKHGMFSRREMEIYSARFSLTQRAAHSGWPIPTTHPESGRIVVAAERRRVIARGASPWKRRPDWLNPEGRKGIHSTNHTPLSPPRPP